MLLTGDYHTHTVYSHGKGTVLENALRAKEIRLQEIAITDHGFEQLAFGLRHREIPQLVRDCREASKLTGIPVYVGTEANLCDEQGRTEQSERCVYLMGIHRFVKFTSFYDFWNLLMRNSLHTTLRIKPSKSLIRYNTNAYINAIKNNPIDVITHLNYQSFCDVAEVAKAARDYGTYIELNSKKSAPERRGSRGGARYGGTFYHRFGRAFRGQDRRYRPRGQAPGAGWTFRVRRSITSTEKNRNSVSGSTKRETYSV